LQNNLTIQWISVPLQPLIKKQTKHMKKVFALFAVAGMLFTASCGNKEVSEEATEEIEVVIEETEEVIEEAAEEVEGAIEEVTEEVKEVVEG
jgi:gas vesicle protein